MDREVVKSGSSHRAHNPAFAGSNPALSTLKEQQIETEIAACEVSASQYETAAGFIRRFQQHLRGELVNQRQARPEVKG